MIVFKTLRIADSQDPELYAAEPIIEWQNSEEGTWVMEHAISQPSYRIRMCPDSWGHVVDIYGDLAPVNETYFRLKWM